MFTLFRKTYLFRLKTYWEKGGLKLMTGFAWLPAITTIELFLRNLTYITIIIVGFKLFKVLNNYINKNPK